MTKRIKGFDKIRPVDIRAATGYPAHTASYLLGLVLHPAAVDGEWPATSLAGQLDTSSREFVIL